MSDKLLVGVPEAAKMCGIDAKTLRKKIEAGEVPAERFGRHIKIPVWWLRELRDGKRA